MEMKGHKGHHHRAMGGKVEPELHPKPYNAQGSHVEEEAEEKKDGGAAMKKRHRHEKLKDGGHVEGAKKKHRMDRPGRKRGGRIGADMAPLSSAAKIKPAEGHSESVMSGNAEDGP